MNPREMQRQVDGLMHTVRTLQASLTRRGANLAPESWVQVAPDPGPPPLTNFVLTEDVDGTTMHGKRSNIWGTVLDETAVEILNWNGLGDGLLTGAVIQAFWSIPDEAWAIHQGPCRPLVEEEDEEEEE